MSEEPVRVQIVEEEGESWIEKFKRWTGRTPQTTLQESDRFSRLGYLQYPKMQDRHLRLFLLIDILEDVDKTLQEMEALRTDKEKYAKASKNIKRLIKAFQVIGSPWFKGLDNRELAQKQNTFYDVEMRCGHLPAFYPDIKKCVQVLISLSWQAVDMIAQTPILMETKTVVQPQGARIDLGSAVKEY